MPAAIIAAIGAAAGWTAATIATVTTIASAVMFVGGIALSSYQRNKAKKRANEEYNAAQVDRLANVVTTLAQRELVLGRVRKGGAIYFRGSAGSYKETFLAHLALAGHEIDAVEQVYLNDVAVTLDANGYVLDAPYAQTRRQSFNATIFAGSTSVVLPHDPVELTVKAVGYTTGPEGGVEIPTVTVSGRTVTLTEAQTYAVTVTYQTNVSTYYARVWWELGSADPAADARTLALFPDLWSTYHRGNGVAKLMAEFTYNETAFPSGVPAISAVIRGAKVYDPRSALTAWSENPALLARHVYQHAYFGKATVSAAEDVRFTTAANACDTAHTYTLSSGVAVSTQLYRAALVVPYGAPARGAIDDLCQAMAGVSAFAGGELHIRAGVYTASVKSLTDADLAVVQRNGEEEEQDALTIAVHKERAQKFNVVNARIWDSEQQYKQVALQPYKAAALITRDGHELAQEISLAGVFFAPQAKHIAGVALRDARDPLVFEAPFKLSAWPLEIFDTVDLTLARYGWTSKTFMILSRSWDHGRGIVRLAMKETAAAIFTPDAAFDPEGYSPNTALPNPFDINPPVLTAAGVSSGTEHLVAQPDGSYQTRVLVTWTAVANAAVTSDGEIEVQWQQVGTTNWNAVKVDGSETSVYLTGPVDATAIVIRARSRTDLAVSDWSLQVVHTVVGKNEPPAAPGAVALTSTLVVFEPSADIDVKGYRVLYNVGSDTDSSVATALHTGLITSSPFVLPIRLYGINTIMVVAVDVVGNESEATSDTQDLGQPDAANVADEVDFVAEGYPGIIVNGTVTDDVLVSDADPDVDFYGAGSGSNIYYRDGAADIYGGDQYLEMEYRFAYASPYDGGVILMDLTVQGPRPTVEYRIDGGSIGDVYSDVRPDFYSDDDIQPEWGSIAWGSASWWLGGGGIYGGEQAWLAWNGFLTPTVAHIGYEFRITVDAGSAQGAVTELALRTEMPQIEQVFGNVSVLAAGTQVEPALGLPARTYIAIEDVQITPIGSVAVGGRVKTYPIDPENGPEIELLDNSANPVEGNAFVRISGY